MKIAMCQMEVIPANPAVNFETMKRFIIDAYAKNAEMVVFPELCISGYLIGDMWEEDAFVKDCFDYSYDVLEFVKQLYGTREHTVVFGNVGIDTTMKNEDGRIRKYNAIFIIHNGEFVKKMNYDFGVKTLSPNYREFEEPRHFYDNRKLAFDDESGIEPYLTSHNGIGYIICEDGWDSDYSIKPIDTLMVEPLELIINLSCSPFTAGKNKSRDRVFANHAYNNAVPIVYVNSIGIQNNGKTIFSFDGSSVVYDAYGNTMARAPMFKETLMLVDIVGGAVKCEQAPADNLDGIAEIHKALEYSVKQYLKSVGTNRVVIGISGGVDSAVAASLYASIVGPENLLLVNMPSKYNSDLTKNIAKTIAKNIGCYYCVVPIEDSVNLTNRQVTQAYPYRFDTNGKIHSEQLVLSDFHMENVQARDRSSRILSAMSSAWGGVFTNNGNKTEATVGYATLYGDVAGFVSALGDLWKHQVYELGQYLNTLNNWLPEDVFTVVASAELSDKQDVTKGQGDPLVYWYHDRLFRSWQEHWKRLTPEDVLLAYKHRTIDALLGIPEGHSVYNLFPNPIDFIDDMERWWKLYKGMGIAKRVQAPPVIALSRRAYGFDLRETLGCVHFTRKYLRYKNLLTKVPQ